MRRTIKSVLGVTLLLAGLTAVSSTTSLNQAFAQVNHPPDCAGATVSPDELWPPNHKWKNVTVTVRDPDGHPLTITITDILQDEPVNGLGDGNTCPDGAGVGNEGFGTGVASVTVQLRAERSGLGDGRLYVIAFSAVDKWGAICFGEVTVCVPHDMGNGRICVDSLLRVDSTVCPPPLPLPVPEEVDIDLPEAETGERVCREKKGRRRCKDCRDEVIFETTQNVFLEGKGFPLGTIANIHVVPNVAWSDGNPIDIANALASLYDVGTDDGDIPCTTIWEAGEFGLDKGNYDVIVDADGNDEYNFGVDVITGNGTSGLPSITVIQMP